MLTIIYFALKYRRVVLMKNKSFWLPLLVSFGTMALLYLIGFIFKLAFLKFQISLNGSFEIALLPIAIGIVVGFIAERIVKTRNK